MIKKDFIYVGIILLLIFLAIFYLQKNQQRPQPQEAPITAYDADREKYDWNITEVATNLEVPWDMALAPNKDIFITERPGRLKILTKNGEVKTVASLPQVASVGESGLTGLALHPDFSKNGYIYLYYTYRKSGGIFNRVSRFIYKNTQISDETIILDQLPGGVIHNGGRLRFGPDKKLWVLTGDGAKPDTAQNMESLGGKVLRINDNGSVPSDNPVKGSLIYSLGHRNPQGLDFHPLTEEILVTEHGETAHDEINLIKPKANYGWPIVKKCFSDNPQYASPILCSEEQTYAPSGSAFIGSKIWRLRDSFFFAGLRGQLLERLEIINGQVTARETVVKDQYGRLRGVLADPKEGVLYVSTSNRDGRGNPKTGDDKILKIQPKLVN
ncbi:PQQ-dependent sugar dehydrogenase [Candidatus Daviesbacteria bacterium]|nr:PQQ-dependent sugar dehydrogenase [Candidatus Daviesbacteria bacterium]